MGAPAHCWNPFCRAVLIADEHRFCSRCKVRAQGAGKIALRAGMQVGAGATRRYLEREHPAAYETLSAGYHAWKDAEGRALGNAAPAPSQEPEGAPQRVRVVDFTAERARRGG